MKRSELKVIIKEVKQELNEETFNDLANEYIDMLNGAKNLNKIRPDIKTFGEKRSDKEIKQLRKLILKLTKGEYKPKIAIEDYDGWINSGKGYVTDKRSSMPGSNFMHDFNKKNK